MIQWMKLLLLVLAITLVFAENDVEEDKTEEGSESPPAAGEDEPSDKDREAMMEKMQNIHLENDAFLGDYVKGFRELNKADREQKLEELIKNEIDTDKDGLVSESELREHFKRTSRMYRQREIEETLKDQDENKDGKISWDEYHKHNFGDDSGDDQKELKDMDRRKFDHADKDGDKLLDLEEYHGFNHPVDNARMANYSIDEQLAKHDADKDGYISYQEYLSSFTDIEDDSIKSELKRDFDETYDKDHDGKLHRDEIHAWAIPEDVFVNEEPAKLVKEADDDRDNKLSLGEISKHLDLFMDKPADEGSEGGDTSAEGDEGSEDTSAGKHDEL